MFCNKKCYNYYRIKGSSSYNVGEGALAIEREYNNVWKDYIVIVANNGLPFSLGKLLHIRVGPMVLHIREWTENDFINLASLIVHCTAKTHGSWVI